MKRKYHSPLRQEQTAQTRQRILAAASELVHSFPSWDWKNLTAKAVGERAGISERTVHRHFSSEQALRDAVLQRLVEESGVQLDGLRLANFDDIVITMFDYLSSFAAAPDTAQDPSQSRMDALRTQALVDAVVAATPNWQDDQQRLVAAVLDMLWQPATQDRLKLVWGLDSAQFSRIARWFVALVVAALRSGRKP